MRLPAALLPTLLLTCLATGAGAVDLRDGSGMDGYVELRALRAARDRVDEKLDRRLRPAPAARSRRGWRPGPRTAPAWRRGGQVRVIVRVEALDDTMRDALAAAGFGQVREDPRRGLVEGWVAASRVRALAALDGVRRVRPADRGQTRAGRFPSADVETRAADVRRTLGAGGLPITGAGVTVGMISDGIEGAAASQAAFDLPPGQPTVPASCEAGGGSEGTAMAEIVHDLAPGATLLFASGIDSTMTFIEAVECLTRAGADVIVDDLAFFGEPYFEDGDLAQAVQEAVGQGVSYHSAAGNMADVHYEGTFRDTPGSAFHDFDAGAGVDNTNELTLPPGSSLLCVLQWDNPFGDATDDYDLLLVDEDGTEIDVSDDVQRGRGDDPLEIVVANSGGSARAGLRIERKRGAARNLELFCVHGVHGLEHATPGSSIFGHAAVPEAIAVAAIDVADPGHDTIEFYSSRGPARLAFPPTSRPKPDLAAFDGVLTGVPGFAPFFGTSAAAPHVAAVAALMLQMNPFLLPAEVQGILAATAVDIGAPGFDDAAGAGRVDAFAAVSAVPPVECQPGAPAPACDDANACTVDACEHGRCTHVPASCDDGNPCNGAESCQPETGVCVPGVPAADGTPCPDGDACDGDEQCAAGSCTPGVPLQCADDDLCTADTCVAASGCQFAPLTGVESVRCVLDRGLPACPGVELPDPVRRRFARAQQLIDRGEAARSRRRQRALVRRAGRVLRRAATAVNRSRTLPRECATSLWVSLGMARARARAVSQGLR